MNDIVYQIATWLVPLTIAIVFHEVAHGYVAKLFGDPTAQRMGRLTLNPIKHVDPVGTVVLPMLLAVTGAPIFGWAKAVPVDDRKLRNPRWHMVLVALAGPGSNILLAFLTLFAMAGVILAFGTTSGGVAGFIWANLTNFIIINIMLAVFNMLPLPPFDGSHVVEGLLPRPLAARYAALRPFGMVAMIALFVALPLIWPGQNFVGRLIGPPVEAILGWASSFLSLLV
jgi:Zn-dependent protease